MVPAFNGAVSSHDRHPFAASTASARVWSNPVLSINIFSRLKAKDQVSCLLLSKETFGTAVEALWNEYDLVGQDNEKLWSYSFDRSVLYHNAVRRVNVPNYDSRTIPNQILRLSRIFSYSNAICCDDDTYHITHRGNDRPQISLTANYPDRIDLHSLHKILWPPSPLRVVGDTGTVHDRVNFGIECGSNAPGILRRYLEDMQRPRDRIVEIADLKVWGEEDGDRPDETLAEIRVEHRVHRARVFLKDISSDDTLGIVDQLRGKVSELHIFATSRTLFSIRHLFQPQFVFGMRAFQDVKLDIAVMAGRYCTSTDPLTECHLEGNGMENKRVWRDEPFESRLKSLEIRLHVIHADEVLGIHEQFGLIDRFEWSSIAMALLSIGGPMCKYRLSTTRPVSATMLPPFPGSSSPTSKDQIASNLSGPLRHEISDIITKVRDSGPKGWSALSKSIE